jgi:hypothetical protein
MAYVHHPLVAMPSEPGSVIENTDKLLLWQNYRARAAGTPEAAAPNMLTLCRCPSVTLA